MLLRSQKKSPLRTWGTLFQLSSAWGAVDEKETLADLHWKLKSGRAGNQIFMFQSLTSHFDKFTSQLKAPERTSRFWLVTFQNGSDSGQVKSGIHQLVAEVLSLPWTRVHSVKRRGLWGCWILSELKRGRQCEKPHTQLLQEASIQHPERVLLLFLTLLHWLRVRSH